ncbi:hypothetical protein [Planobispora takensis]|uniref:Uncharacterized protein n=1 Tax=Planobispora takensis TaxID=1367882 RepID=A0A8J3WTJ9_9ACTN|nr:hypothetical protein [Planobispora takensis]GII00458.1 hypothetical protein Pta02_24660 [Planobispora takensis]
MRRFGMLLALAGLVMAGCSGGDAGTGLRGAMSEVSGGEADQPFAYNDLAHWRELGVMRGREPEAEGPWLDAAYFGLDVLGTPELRDSIGVDLSAADRAVSVGHRPAAVRLDGAFDAAAVRDKLVASGGKPVKVGDHEVISRGGYATTTVENGGLAVRGNDDPFAEVAVSDSVIATGPGLADVLGGPLDLEDHPEYVAVADCLGDVVTAALRRPETPGGVRLYGVGLRRPGSADERPSSVICVLPEPTAGADARRGFAGGFTTRGTTDQGEPIGRHAEEIVHDEVESEGLTVLRAGVRHTAGSSASFFLKTFSPENLL